MKHSVAAIAAVIAAAGVAGAVHAQSMTPPGSSPTQNMQSNQYTGQTPTQPYGAQYNPYAAQQPAATASQQNNPQWNAAQQQNNAAAQQNNANAQWNAAQQNGAQRPAVAPSAMQRPGTENAMSQAGDLQFWSHNISQDTVREAQQRLASSGLYRGREDGLMGRETARGIAQFQRRNGLRVTGSLDQETLDRLVGPSAQGYGASAGQQPQASAQPMGAAPMNQGAMNQAPTAGAYNTTAGNPAANSQSHAPIPR